MKKILAALCASALLLSLTACSGDPSESPGGGSQNRSSDSSSTIPDSSVDGSSAVSDNDSTQSDHESSTPEPQKPDGEPTFLTAPDGTPIYTSEITEVYTGSEQFGDKKTITLAEAEQAAKDGGDFTVKCDGFFYGCTPERAVNYIDNPELFKDRGSDGESFEYLGETFDLKTLEGKYSTDYMRIKPGDKFGSLTVKNAYTLFTKQYWPRGKDFSDVPGVYLEDVGIEFDGELELTGYVDVTKMETFYGEGGDMRFYPDGDSSVILPDLDYFLNEKARCVCNITRANYSGYIGSSYDIGNMYKVDCDTSGLNPGDKSVKVKVVLDNIRYVPGDFGGLKVELKSIDLI